MKNLIKKFLGCHLNFSKTNFDIVKNVAQLIK